MCVFCVFLFPLFFSCVSRSTQHRQYVWFFFFPPFGLVHRIAFCWCLHPRHTEVPVPPSFSALSIIAVIPPFFPSFLLFFISSVLHFFRHRRLLRAVPPLSSRPFVHDPTWQSKPSRFRDKKVNQINQLQVFVCVGSNGEERCEEGRAATGWNYVSPPLRVPFSHRNSTFTHFQFYLRWISTSCMQGRGRRSACYVISTPAFQRAFDCSYGYCTSTCIHLKYNENNIWLL